MKFELDKSEAQWLINFVAQHATIAEGVNVFLKLKSQEENQPENPLQEEKNED